MYVEAMEKLEAEFYPAVDRVVSNWTRILAQCREIQGSRFDPSNYPPSDRVRGFFQFLRSMTPMPRPQDIAGTLTSSASTGWTPSTRKCSRSWLQPCRKARGRP